MQIRLKNKLIEASYTDEEHLKIAKTLSKDGYQAICLNYLPEGDISYLRHYDGVIQGLFLPFNENTVVMEDIPNYLPNLNALFLRDLRKKKKKVSLDFLSQFDNLEILQALNCRSDVTFLGKLKSIKYLYLSYLTHEQLDYIASLSQLRQLKITNSTLYNVDFLQHLEKLEILELESVRKLADLTPVKYLTSLRKLHLDAMGGVTSLPDLSNNKYLEVLALRNIHNLIDLNALSSVSLKYLFLAGLGKKLDITPVKEYKNRVPNLKTFCFYQVSKKQTQEACQYIDEDILDNHVIKKYQPQWMWDFFCPDS